MEHLVKAAINGQEDAFEQLVESEKSKLLAKAYSYVGNWEDAADIVQETFLKAFKSIQQLKEPKYFSTWLFKILIRESFSFLKQKKRTFIIETELLQQYIPAHEPTPSAYELVHEALSYLRDEYRTTLVLFYFYDFKVQEIASMLDKPKNTVKMHLHRGRHHLKKQIEKLMKQPILSKEVLHLLKEQLAKSALHFVSVPEHYHLLIEDYTNDQATFMWGTKDLEEGIEVSLDRNGKLVELTKPPSKTGTVLSREQQKVLAEKFLTKQHEEAFDYLTLSNVIEKDDSTKFEYEQYVGGYPLASHYTKIVVSSYGEVIKFNYKGYTKNPPSFPEQLVDKQVILQQVYQAKWTLSLRYLLKSLYSVPESGLYPIYESSIVYQSFNATSGETSYEEESGNHAKFIPFPHVKPATKQATIEEIIGIPDSMDKLREIILDNDDKGLVWRDKSWQAPKENTMNSFLLERIEDTVKAKVAIHTNKLKEFIWFKERTGELELSFEKCRDIACTFIATYFSQYTTYLLLKIEKPAFNEVNRAFFTFPLHDGNGHIIDGEQFYVGVNRTTGFIDVLWGPDLDLNIVESYNQMDILSFEQVKSALKNVEVHLSWSKQYDQEEANEELQYKLGMKNTKQKIYGINAVTGELICSKL